MRERTAYEIFRGGFRTSPPPAWDALEPWMRDALRVAYLQGKLDGPSAADQANAAIVASLVKSGRHG